MDAPNYDEPTQQQCLEVRRRNCGVTWQVVLFYSRRQSLPIKPKKVSPAPSPHSDMLHGLKALGWRR